MLVTLHLWPAHAQQFQDNSLASLANYTWQPQVDLQQQQQRQANSDNRINSIDQSAEQNAISPGVQQQQQEYPILEQQSEAREC